VEVLVDELLEAFEAEAVGALAGALRRRLGEGAAARAAGDPRWWRAAEAAALAVGSAYETLRVGGGGGGGVGVGVWGGGAWGAQGWRAWGWGMHGAKERVGVRDSTGRVLMGCRGWHGGEGLA
jgi:hypothetical protein